MNIGWIGTGIMGFSMCHHLQQAGHNMFVYNRSKPKTEKLIANGATWCDTPADVAKNADIVFSIVGMPKDVEEIYLGEKGVLSVCKPGTICVDMTTSKPSLAKLLYAVGKEKGVNFLDAPVSGGDIGARSASLAIMVGGEKNIFDKVCPLFELMGKNIRLMGKIGSGQHTKMSNQILLAGTMIGVVESLMYASKANLDLNAIVDVIGSGAAASWAINNLGRQIAKNDFSPGFLIKHYIKDMGIALEEAKQMNLSLPGLALVQQFYIFASANNWDELGTQGLYKVLLKMNNLN